VTQPAIVVVFSDIHVNSTAGLLPPKVRRDDGSTHLSNKTQRWLWKQYLALWAYVAERKELLGARVTVVFNGDGPDRNKHSDGYDMIAASRADIVRWTVDVLKPASPRARIARLRWLGRMASLCSLMWRRWRMRWR